MSDQADRGKDKRILILVLGVTAIVSFCCCFSDQYCVESWLAFLLNGLCKIRLGLTSILEII